MEIVLLGEVANLGNLGDKMNIKGSYACNFLLPQGEATVATIENVTAFKARRAELEETTAEKKATAKAHAAQFPELVITLGAHASDEDKLFGSISIRDIAEAISAADYPLEKTEVRLPNGALRNASEFDVAVHLHTDVETTLKLTIVAEQAIQSVGLDGHIRVRGSPLTLGTVPATVPCPLFFPLFLFLTSNL